MASIDLEFPVSHEIVQLQLELDKFIVGPVNVSIVSSVGPSSFIHVKYSEFSVVVTLASPLQGSPIHTAATGILRISGLPSGAFLKTTVLSSDRSKRPLGLEGFLATKIDSYTSQLYPQGVHESVGMEFSLFGIGGPYRFTEGVLAGLAFKGTSFAKTLYSSYLYGANDDSTSYPEAVELTSLEFVEVTFRKTIYSDINYGRNTDATASPEGVDTSLTFDSFGWEFHPPAGFIQYSRYPAEGVDASLTFVSSNFEK